MQDSLDFQFLEYNWGKEFVPGKVKLIDLKKHPHYCRTKRNDVSRIYISNNILKMIDYYQLRSDHVLHGKYIKGNVFCFRLYDKLTENKISYNPSIYDKNSCLNPLVISFSNSEMCEFTNIFDLYESTDISSSDESISSIGLDPNAFDFFTDKEFSSYDVKISSLVFF